MNFGLNNVRDRACIKGLKAIRGYNGRGRGWWWACWGSRVMY
jgi:hypothetical protein